MRHAIMGIDPGFTYVGVAVARFLLSRPKALHVATLETPTQLNDGARLDMIARELWAVAHKYGPEAIAYEDQTGVEVAMQRTGVGTNKWSRRVHDVQGMARAIAAVLGVPCYEVAPNTAKLAFTGMGNATKDQMVSVARRFYSLDDVSEHGADALAVAKCGHRLLGVDQLRTARRTEALG